jgi:hypothetical protein
LPSHDSFIWRAWSLQFRLDHKVRYFIKWFGPRTIIMFLSLPFFVWSLLTILFYVFGVLKYPDPFYNYKNGLDYLVNGATFHDVVKNPLLVFILSGGIFMYFLLLFCKFKKRNM